MERPIAILAVVLAAAPALAGPGEDHYARAQRAEEAGEYALASAEYISAYGELKDPRLFYYVARAYEKEGRASTAVIYYKRYLREVEVPEAHRREVLETIARLELPRPKPAYGTRTELHARPAAVAPPGLASPAAVDFGAAEVDAPVPSKPPLSGGRLMGELFLGNLLGLAGGAVGVIATVEDSEDTAIIAGLGGYALGSATGVYAVGAAGDETGSFGATFLGSVVGTAVGVGLLVDANEDEKILLAMTMPTIGAMVGFNLTRKWEKRHEREVVPYVVPTNGGFGAGVGGTF